MQHGVKLGPGPQDLRPRDTGIQDLGPPLKFKSGTWDPLQSLKVRPLIFL